MREEWEEKGIIFSVLIFFSSHKQQKSGRVTGGKESTVHPSPKEVFEILSPVIQLSSHSDLDPGADCYPALYLHHSGHFHLPMKVRLL